MQTELNPQIHLEDQHLIVLSKPAGLLSQGESSGEENLVEWLREHVGRNYIGLVHRLDRNTSGLMVVAKRTKAARRLTESLKNGELVRLYHAWLIGNMEGSAVWEHWLLKNEKQNKVLIVKSGSPKAKRAKLAVTSLGKGKFKKHALTLAEFKLETGRSHQIRAQAAEMNFPVLGDPKYGVHQNDTAARAFGRPALHSYRLQFPHPMTGDPVEITDDLPQDMQALLEH